MSRSSRQIRKAKTSRRHLKFKRIALLEKLEVREVPAISIIGTEIRIAGSELNDQVSISPGTRGLGQIVVTHTRIGTGGSTTESRTFALASVASIGVALGNGDNTFVNQTSLPSKVMGGLGADTFTGGSGNDEFLGQGAMIRSKDSAATIAWLAVTAMISWKVEMVKTFCWAVAATITSTEVTATTR